MDLNRKRRNIALMIGFFVILHFTISIIAGIKIGEVSRNLLEDRSKVPRNVTQNPEIAKQWLDKEIRDTMGFWYQAFHLSQRYPVGWILTSKAEKIQRGIRNEYLKGNLSRAQVAARIGVIASAKAFINSFFAGFCLFGGGYLVRKIIKKA